MRIGLTEPPSTEFATIVFDEEYSSKIPIDELSVIRFS